jgi:hypothetical protein
MFPPQNNQTRRDDKAPPVASTPSVAVGATSTASSATPVDFGALLADEPGSFDPTLQVVAAKYLIGVFILDSLAMAVREGTCFPSL